MAHLHPALVKDFVFLWRMLALQWTQRGSPRVSRPGANLCISCWKLTGQPRPLKGEAHEDTRVGSVEASLQMENNKWQLTLTSS